jgi:hypothetical protein
MRRSSRRQLNTVLFIKYILTIFIFLSLFIFLNTLHRLFFDQIMIMYFVKNNVFLGQNYQLSPCNFLYEKI